MSLKSYLWPVALASALALASFIAIMGFFTPENAGLTIKTLLFLSLFLGLWGIFSLAGVFIHRRLKRARGAEELLAVAFREGFFLSALLIGFILMRIEQIFFWWSALIFLIIITAIEVAILGKDK